MARLSDLRMLRPFERTAGDEFQGVLDETGSVVTAVLNLVRDGHWSIGVGIGPVEHPLPAMTRAGRGVAFHRAREAVDVAKRAPQHLAVRSGEPDTADDLSAVLTLLSVVMRARTRQAWEAIDLAVSGLGHAAIAAKLGVTRQAIGQRLTAAHWREEQQARRSLYRLVDRALAASGALEARGALEASRALEASLG